MIKSQLLILKDKNSLFESGSSKKDKNSLFESGSSKKSRLIGLCGVWGWVTTYSAAAVAAPSPNRLHPIKSQIQIEDRNVNPAIG